ncbi:Permeases of the major facilitator superfamily [Collimonas arenae]|uniref:Permeases of the major facilitator superfamily n=1 Tax=Collimonas arenae TaxID=279058 RepID=A0A0A1FB15_9BURK|nr:MFS transporter [Collimonas arenae]AIY41938.1 Permeases of the major facilitator superfamily [Collimonas arenae]
MAVECPTPANLVRAAPSGLLPLITLAIGFVMAMLDVTAVNVALADISHNLRVPLSGLVWVVDGYTLTFAALLLVGGALADRYGAKTVYLSGLAVFMLGSALCGAAPNGNTLIAARMLQGVGSALFMPSSLSLLTHAYQDDRVRARMLGTWSAIVAVAAAMGPLVGGILVDGYGWRSVFLINLPVGLLGLLLAQNAIPAAPRHWRTLPIFSHALGISGLAGLCFTLIEGPVYGWTSAPILATAALFVIALALLVRREQRGAEPLLPRALFATPHFTAANAIGFLINFSAFGQLFLLSLFLQQARGSDALHTGLQLLPVMAVFSVGNLLSGRITARWGARMPMLGGLLLATSLTALLSGMRPDTPYLLLALAVAIANWGVGIAIPAMTTTVMQVAGRSHANSAAAALNANRQIGALVGVAIIGSILHIAPSWETRLPLAFGAIALAYGAAALLVWRYINAQANLSRATV